MDANELRAVLAVHRKWLRGEGGGVRANLSGLNLARSDLSWSDLTGSDLFGSDLSGACLRGSNLTGSDMYGANLRGADLRGAILSGTNLSRADGVIDAGERSDGPRFVGWLKDGTVMICAGCRNMTLAEYREHNAKREDALIRAETAAILDRIEAGARARGWIGDAT